MFKVVGFVRTRAFRVLWTLEEMDLPYEYLPFRPQSGDTLNLVPNGKVPALIEGENTVTDSVAIMTYLADRFGKLTAPAGSWDRAHQDSMIQFLVDEFDACLWTAARHSFVLPEDKRVPEIKESLKWEFERSQKEFARRLGDSPFVMGSEMTIADILATHCGTWARNAKFSITEPKFSDYIDRMTARPAWKRVAALAEA
jgi:glutathione S-transferase